MADTLNFDQNSHGGSMPGSNNPDPNVDEEFDDEAGYEGSHAYDSSYNAAPYALVSNLNRLGFALARSQAQAAVGVSQIVGGVLTSLIDAANVSTRPFQPYAGYYPDEARRRSGDRRPRDDDEREVARLRRMAAGGPMAASSVVTDGINQAVADALHTFSRAAADFAQSYAPGEPSRRPTRDRDEPEPRRRGRTTREDVRRAGEQVVESAGDAAARVETKNK
jgi:hypothetical protein